MEAVAQTLGYDSLVLGDGAVPTDVAGRIRVPTLIVDGSESTDFKHVAADDLARAVPGARRKTLAGQSTMAPPEVLAPVLAGFFK